MLRNKEQLHPEGRTILGLDVVGLFPAIQSASRGRIVRRRIMKSEMKLKGFDWKHGARYIVVNNHLTGELKSIWNILPWTKSGKVIGIKNK